MSKKKYKPIQRASGVAVGPLQLSYKWSQVLRGILLVFAVLIGLWFVVAWATGVQSTISTVNGLVYNLGVVTLVFSMSAFMIHEGIKNRSPDLLRLVSFAVSAFTSMLGLLNILYIIGYQSIHASLTSRMDLAQLESLPHPILVLLGAPRQIHPFFAASSWVAVTVVLLVLLVIALLAMIESHRNRNLLPDYRDENGIDVTSVHEADMTEFKSFFIAFYNASSKAVQKGFDKLLIDSGLEPDTWLMDYFLRESEKGNFRVALKNGYVVGYLLNSDHLFSIEMLVVRTDQRNTGVGKALVDDFKTRALKDNNHRLNIFIREDNLAARNFFEHEGWRPFGRRGEDLLFSFEKSDMRNAIGWFNVHQNECGVIPPIKKIELPDESAVVLNH